MKILFTVHNREIDNIIAEGSIDFPDESKAKDVHNEMMKKATTILESMFYVDFKFETNEERESFMKRLTEEQNAPELFGADGNPIGTGRIIQM